MLGRDAYLNANLPANIKLDLVSGQRGLGARFWCGLGQIPERPEVRELVPEGTRKPRPLGDMISSAADAKEAQRSNGRRSNLINNPTQLLPGPSEEKHQPLKGRCPKIQKDEEVQEQVGGPKSQAPPRAPPRAVPGEPSAPWSRHETHHRASLGALWTTLQAQKGGCLGVQDTLWDAGKEHLGVAQVLLWDV